jgi:hypothetical protein
VEVCVDACMREDVWELCPDVYVYRCEWCVGL